MQSTQIKSHTRNKQWLNKKTVVEGRWSKHNLLKVLYSIGPFLLITFLLLGSIFEWHYWNRILWVLLY